MKIKISVQLKVSEMYNFLMHHTYFSFMGYVGILISLCAWAAAIYTWGKMPLFNVVLLIMAGLMFTVIQPVMLYLKAKTQILKNPMFAKPIDYEFSNEGILISQGEDSNALKWNEVTKITSTSKSVLIYLAKTRAFIITKEALGSQFEEFKKIAKKNATARYIKIK